MWVTNTHFFNFSICYNILSLAGLVDRFNITFPRWKKGFDSPIPLQFINLHIFMLKFEEFAQLEIKIATIIEAEPVPDTDKLIKLLVDLGDEQRQVVAGIAQKHTVADLIGKQVPVILNLEPVTLRGVESNGMIMAIDDEDISLLIPEHTVPNGSIVK